MSADAIGVVDPTEAYNALKSKENALLIDVRTRAEWTFVGAPDPASIGGRATFIEWQTLPGMQVNAGFADSALEAAAESGADEIYFICRSGARSLAAATATAAAAARAGRPLTCINVAEGFEGDLDAAGHRGRVNGWKARDLPWRQN